MFVLGSIGVSAAPPDPATEFEQLEAEKLNPAWLSGAVHPISMRGLAALLLATLPKEALRSVGCAFVEAGCDDEEDGPPRRLQALTDLSVIDKPDLNSYPDEPIVSVNPAASGRQIAEAAAQLLRQWKDERQLEERRDRSDKYGDYLRVWDLREGWHGGEYDRTKERKLREVAAELKLSINTVHNHYRRAFEMIVGHPYSPELWYRIVGPLKLSELYGPAPGPVSRRRPLASPTRRDVPESVVGPASEDGSAKGPVGLKPASSGDRDFMQLVNDIRGLLDAGRTDRQIAEELDLSDAAIHAIAYLRERDGDLP